MPAHQIHDHVDCPYFRWRLFQRNAVWYADGRFEKRNLGIHSLGTQVRNEAESNLRKLDFQMAVKHGLARDPGVDPDSCLAISRGWDLSLEWCDRPPVMGGASNKTLNKYKRSQVLHRNFCDMEGIHIGMTLEKMSWNGTGEVWEGDTRIAPCILS